MLRLPGSIHLSCLAAVLALLAACAGSPATDGSAAKQAAPGNTTQELDPVLEGQLMSALQDELIRLRKDPERTAASAPSGEGNAVFHLLVDATAPDGLGSQGESSLLFYPRMVGDYDGNGEVGISDITPLGLMFGQSVEYDDPAEHGGITYWPSGDPDGEGRENWRRARVDGDGNGEINTADITPIAIHFGEHADGWRVEQRFDAEGEFEFLPHAEDNEAAFSVAWSELAPDSIGYLLEGAWPDSGYLEMRVQAWENASESGGPLSDSAVFEHPSGSCTAFLQADPVVADFPFDASFTVAGSSVVADSYQLDFGDGTVETYTSLTEFPVLHSYTESGVFIAELTVTCGTEQATDDLEIMSTPLPCELQVMLGVMPDNGFAPLNVLFDPTGTSMEASGYSLDFGDGSAVLEAASLAQLAVQHEYTESGEYTAVLTAQCDSGGSVLATVEISVGNPSDECSVNLSVTTDTPLIGTDTEFFFGGTTGNAALLDFGDGTEPLFVNLQGPEPILYEYAASGTYLAELSIICNESVHSDSVLVFVQPEPVSTFDVSGGVFRYESNPPIGGPEPDKFALPGAEMEIENVTDGIVEGTTTTDAAGQYFFDGDALGLDVSKIYVVKPTQAELDKWLPVGWLPGQAFIVLPEAGMVKICPDINLLAT